MPSQEFSITDNGGIRFEMTDENGNTRAVIFEPNDGATVDLVVEDASGNSNRTTIDPSGGGTALGK